MRWPLCSRPSNLFRTALVTGALSTEAAKGSDAPFDPRVHALRRHRGQADCAAALRALMAGSAIRESHRLGDDRVQDPYCLRCQPQVMGAVLDTLRQVAAMLAAEANGVSDNPLIFADEGEALSGGNFHAEPVAIRRRHHGARHLRDRRASPSGASPCWSTRRCRGCRRSSRRSRASTPAS